MNVNDNKVSQPQGDAEASAAGEWVLVPRSPTKEMAEAFFSVFGKADWFDKGYAAMLAAAPNRPAQEKGNG